MKSIEKVKEHKIFNVYKCRNDECSFYRKNVKSMSKKDRELFKSNPSKFKVRYIYRSFRIVFKLLSKQSPKFSKINLSKIYCSAHTLGLILTMLIIVYLLEKLLVLNYTEAASDIVKPFVDNYDYDL